MESNEQTVPEDFGPPHLEMSGSPDLEAEVEEKEDSDLATTKALLESSEASSDLEEALQQKEDSVLATTKALFESSEGSSDLEEELQQKEYSDLAAKKALLEHIKSLSDLEEELQQKVDSDLATKKALLEHIEGAPGVEEVVQKKDIGPKSTIRRHILIEVSDDEEEEEEIVQTKRNLEDPDEDANNKHLRLDDGSKKGLELNKSPTNAAATQPVISYETDIGRTIEVSSTLETKQNDVIDLTADNESTHSHSMEMDDKQDEATVENELPNVVEQSEIFEENIEPLNLVCRKSVKDQSTSEEITTVITKTVITLDEIYISSDEEPNTDTNTNISAPSQSNLFDCIQGSNTTVNPISEPCATPLVFLAIPINDEKTVKLPAECSSATSPIKGYDKVKMNVVPRVYTNKKLKGISKIQKDCSQGSNMTVSHTPEQDCNPVQIININAPINDERAAKCSTANSSAKPPKKRRENTDFMHLVPKVSLSRFGGFSMIREAFNEIFIQLRCFKEYGSLADKFPRARGYLLHGPPGCGKSFLVRALAGEFKLPLFSAPASELLAPYDGSNTRIKVLFNRALSQTPCFLFIDDIDIVCPKRDRAEGRLVRRLASQLLACIDDLNESPKANDVVLIGATNKPDALDSALTRAGRLDREICLGIPDTTTRHEILQAMTVELKPKFDVDIEELAKSTTGFVGADLAAVISQSAIAAVNRYKLSGKSDAKGLLIEDEDIKKVLKDIKPSSIHEGFITTPIVRWENIRYLEDLRAGLKRTIMMHVKCPDKCQEFGLSPPAASLLYGPPRCGKRFVATSVAKELNLNFISMKDPELLGMSFGDLEVAVKRCFQRARKSQPCLIFFDRLEALCLRKSDSTEGEKSVNKALNQIIKELENKEGREQVFIMATTNHPDMLDPSLLRHGRFEDIHYVGLPTPTDRVIILKHLTEDGTKPALKDVDLDALGASPALDGFTPPDLAALVREAALQAFRDCHNHEEEAELYVDSDKFKHALNDVSPSVTPEEKEYYEKMRDTYGPPRRREDEDA